MALQNVQWLGSNIKEDDNHRLVTNNQIETWDNKADKEWIELTPSNWKEYMEEATSDNVVINNILIPCAVDNPFYVFPVYGADQKFVINLGMQAYLMDNLGAIVNFSVLKIDKSYNEFLSNFLPTWVLYINLMKCLLPMIAILVMVHWYIPLMITSQLYYMIQIHIMIWVTKVQNTVYILTK